MPQRPRSTGLPIVRAVVGDVERGGRRATSSQYDARLMRDAAVVLPLVGVADLRVEGGQLLQRLLLGLARSSSRGRSMVSPIASSRFLTSSCMRALAAGGKYFSTYFWPSASPSRSSVDLDAALPARLHLLRAAEDTAPLNAKSSARRRRRTANGAAEASTCHARYVFQSGERRRQLCRSTSCRNSGSFTLRSPGGSRRASK